MNDDPAFEVHVGDKSYRIWSNGRTEGFESGDERVIIINRIPMLQGGLSRRIDVVNLDDPVVVLSYQAELDRG